METISSFNIAISVGALRDGFNAAKVPDPLHEPFQSLLPRITRAAVQSPAAVYLFSSDADAEVRNLFGYALAAGLMQHIPSTLLVDCGFLDVGLNGVVPERDALGFLDLLLYGSSLGVITQETRGGVRVVGAGSFPVTKKMPFVLNSFLEASRRLVSHAGCAVYCGPHYDDDGGLHPLVRAVDIPILVRTTAAGSGVVDPVEEQISAQCDAELLSVRIDLRGGAAEDVPGKESTDELFDEPEVVPPPAPRSESGFEEIESDTAATQRITRAPGPAPEPPPREAPPSRPEPPPPEATAPPAAEAPAPAKRSGAGPAVEFDEEYGQAGQDGGKYTSLAPKIATIALALLVVVFLVWWFTEERGNGGTSELGSVATSQTGQPTAGTGPDDEVEAAIPPDTSAAVAAQDTAPPPVVEGATPAPAPDTATSQEPSTPSRPVADRGAGGVIDPSNILVMDDLENDWGGQFVVHVSSFRESDKARAEVADLLERGFPVFIVYIDLGLKGNWYRVYAGPMGSRDEARDMKKNLDDTPGVRFTRITQIPD